MKITATVKTLKEILEIEEVDTYDYNRGICFKQGYWNFEMNKHIGEEVELKEIDINNKSRYAYEVEGRFYFKKCWLKDIKKEVEWSKVPVDTKILVKNHKDFEWAKRNFSKYKNGVVYTFDFGRNSWTCDNENFISSWKYAKLADDDNA